jgi:hypothetical protein
MIAAFALATVASLTVPMSNGSDMTVQVREDDRSGYAFSVDCKSKCAKPLHFDAGIHDTPVGLVDLQTDGLVYSVWGTGCCFIVRVWQITPTDVRLLFETGSRTQPSLLGGPELAIETYMRPTDWQRRELGTKVSPMRWSYRQGRFIRS